MNLFQDLSSADKPDSLSHVLDSIPYARFLDLKASVSGDTVFLHLPFKTDIIGNPNLPAIHGGVLGALLEITCVAQLLHHIDFQHLPKTIDLSIDYLRSAGPQDVTARAYVNRRGRRVANVRAELWQDDPDRLLCIAHGNFLMRPANQPTTREES